MPAAKSSMSQAKEKIGSHPISAAPSVNIHTLPGTGRPKQRNSILVAASGALSFSLRRSKRATIPHGYSQTQRPPVVDEVLEISAEAAQKDGVAERERLRDAAAQAVGLAGTTSSDQTTVAASTRDDDVSVMSSAARSAKHQRLSRANQNITALPPYPATLSSLQPFVQHSSALLKYHPSQSAFLRLQRSRQWKIRHLVLTSFRCPSESDSSTGTGDNTTQAQLHLFKSSNGDEKEIDRLGINQDSVIYVADGGFGGNKEFVVKVAGFLCGEGSSTSSNNSPSTATSSATVWLLQLPDLVHMQRWIQFIKSSVLTQRAEKAGLGPHFYNNTYNGSGPELKGDLDLMISMGKQGLLPSTPQLSTFEGGTLASRDRDKDSNPSTRSRQSITANPSSSSNGAVSALRGLFNGRPASRQLSTSRTSIGLPSQLSGSTTQPQDDDTGSIVQSVEDPGQTTRNDPFMRTFRPNSPPVVGHTTSLSPPLSPSHSLTTGESTSLKPASPTMGSHAPISGARHFLPGSSGTSSRTVTHSNNFSFDWDVIDGSSSSQMPSGTHEKRISSACMALTPPPRNRRPYTTSTIPSGSKNNWLAREHDRTSSADPAVIKLDLTQTLEQSYHPLDARGSPRIVPKRIAEGMSEGASLRELNGDDDTMNDTVRANSFPVPIPHIPSPIVTPASLLHSSASSFAGGASNHNQSNRHSIHSGRNSILSERSPRPPSHVSLASYDTDTQHPVQHPIKEVSESDPLPSADLGGPSPRGSDVQAQTEGSTERPNSFGCDPPSEVEKVNSARLRFGTLPKQTPPPPGPPPLAPVFGISPSSLHSPSPTPENASGHHSHDRPPSPTLLGSTLPSAGDSLTGRYPQPPSLNGHAHPHPKRMSTISSTSARSGWSATSGSTNTEQSKGSFGVPTGGPLGATRAVKVSSGSISSQGPSGSLVHGNGNRTSILPPQRPIPSAALPSPPMGEVPERRQSYFSNRSIPFSATDSTSGSPIRPEFSLRSSRMSMAPPAPPQGALPPRPDEVSRLSMSSFGSGASPLHAILASPPTGTASLHHGIVPPPTTSPPMRPLPPTPEVLQDRSQSPALSVHSAHSAHSTRSIGSLGKLPSLRLRLRMMNSSSPSPAPPAAAPGREGALPEPRRSQQLARLPPAPPPPTSPPPSIPSLPPPPSWTLGHRGHDRTDSNASYGHTVANRTSMSTVHSSSIGEAITSRLEQYPLSSILPMSPSPLYPSRQMSPPPNSYVRPLPQFPLQQQSSPYERHSLSPPPRRSSRASQHPPPDRDRERTDSLPRRQRPVPEGSPTGGRVVQMKHSAINLAGEGGGPFSSNL